MKFDATPLDAKVDLRYVLLHFVDGSIVDGRYCPRGILARNHWHQVDGIFPGGVPNTACACSKDATSPDSESGEAHDETARQHAVSVPAN